MCTELLIGYALNPDFSFKSIVLLVVKSSKSDDLAQTLPFYRCLYCKQ